MEVVQGDARRWPQQTAERFDLILADPPFDDARAEELLAGLSTCLKPSGMVYLETPAAVEPAAGWQVWRAARAGQVHYQLLVPQDPRAADPDGGTQSGS